MTTMNRPNPNKVFPNPNLPRLCFIKNVVKNPWIMDHGDGSDDPISKGNGITQNEVNPESWTQLKGSNEKGI